METAVLHPQDCLAPSTKRNPPSHRLPHLPECSSARSVSVFHETVIDRTSSRAAEFRNRQGHNHTSVGLLRVPDHASRSQVPCLRREAFKFVSSRDAFLGGGSLQFPLRLYLSTPMRRSLLSSYDRDDAMSTRIPLISAQHECAALPSISVTGQAHSADQPISAMAKTPFPRPDLPKWPDQHKARLLSEDPHSNHTSARRTAVRQARNHVEDVQLRIASRKISTFDRRMEGTKQLSRCMPEKIQENIRVYDLPAPCYREAARGYMAKSYSKYVPLIVHSQSRKGDAREESAVVSNSEREVGVSTMQATPGHPHERRISKPSPQLAPPGVTRTSQSAWSQFSREERSLQWKLLCSGGQGNRCIHESKGHSSDESEVCAGNSPARNSGKSEWNFRAEGVSECLDTMQDMDGWLSMVDERWAGPSFFNSPPPSSLPVPSFTSRPPRSLSAHPETLAPEGCRPSRSLNGLFPEAKRTWDAAFATNDLRRLLHLDHARCNG